MSPTALNWMLFLHVLAALWLAGGVFAGAVVRAQGRKAATLGERALALRIAWRLANVYNLPGAIIAGILGFGGLAAGAAEIAKVIFYIFLVLLVLSLLFGSRIWKNVP